MGKRCLKNIVERRELSWNVLGVFVSRICFRHGNNGITRQQTRVISLMNFISFTRRLPDCDK